MPRVTLGFQTHSLGSSRKAQNPPFESTNYCQFAKTLHSSLK
ncbi:Uncharacterised protein [Vibrio cholerae]|nr:Uncharacterised protein [Vibrio cholerae]